MRPGALLAHRTRTMKRCSSDARSKGQPWPLLLGEVWEIGDSWKVTHVGPVLPERAPSEGPRSTAALRPTWMSLQEEKGERTWKEFRIPAARG